MLHCTWFLKIFCSNTELTIESVVARHRRQFHNTCHCCHCQKHNNYILSSMNTTSNQGSLPSPNDEDSRCGVLAQRDKDTISSHTLSSMSYNLIINGNDDQAKNTMCARGVCEKENCMCLNRKYSDHIRNALNKKGMSSFFSCAKRPKMGIFDVKGTF